jgi:hypothetical protein
LITAYRGLPRANHLDSIAGIGAATATVPTAFAVTSAAVRSAGVTHPPNLRARQSWCSAC